MSGNEADGEFQALTLRPHFLGICGTDIAILNGLRGPRPSILGHEVVARVERSESSTLPVGSTVTLNPTRFGSPEQQFGEAIDGAFRRSFELGFDFIENEQVIPLPAGLDPFVAVFAEPIACVSHSQAVMGSLARQNVAILGAGIYARLHGALALFQGAASVTYLNRSRARLLDLKSRMMDERVRFAQFADRPQLAFDAVIIAVSSEGGRLFELAQELVRPGGMVNLWGGIGPTDTVLDDRGKRYNLYEVKKRNECVDLSPPEPISYKGKTFRMVGSRGARNSDFERAFGLLLQAPEIATNIATHVAGFDRLTDCLTAQRTGELDDVGNPIVKTIIDMELGDSIMSIDEWVRTSGREHS